MESLFETFGQTFLSAIATAAFIAIVIFFIFGTETTDGPLAEYMIAVLRSILPEAI